MKKSYQLSPSKHQIRYTDEFKRHVCNEYLTGQNSKNGLAKKYSIGGRSTRITVWLRELGYEDTPSIYEPTYIDTELKEMKTRIKILKNWRTKIKG